MSRTKKEPNMRTVISAGLMPPSFCSRAIIYISDEFSDIPARRESQSPERGSLAGAKQEGPTYYQW